MPKIEAKIGPYCPFFFINVFESNKLHFQVIDPNPEAKYNINYVFSLLTFLSCFCSVCKHVIFLSGRMTYFLIRGETRLLFL